MARWITILLFLSCLGAVRADDIMFGRLRVPASDDWTKGAVAESGRTMDLVPKGRAGRGVLRIDKPVVMQRGGLVATLERIIAARHKGQQVLEDHPVHLRRTRLGVPVAAKSSSLRTTDDGVVHTLTFGISVGQAIQVVTLIAKDAETIKALATKSGALVGRMAVVFPTLSEKLEPIAGKRRQVFNASHPQPDWLKVARTHGVSTTLHHYRVPLKGLSKGFELGIVSTLQNRIPEAPRPALASWLLGSDGAVPATRGAKVDIVAYHDLRLPSGQQCSSVLLREMKGKVPLSWRFGTMVHGPSWSFLIGASVGRTKAFSALGDPQRLALIEHLRTQVSNRLHALAGSVRWSSDPIKVRKDLRQRLMKKRVWRWEHDQLYFAGTTSMGKNTVETWRFEADGTCSFKSTNSILTLDTGPVTPGTGTVTSDGGWGKGGGGKPRFGVVELSAKTYLLVVQPTGWIRLHLLEFDKKGSYGSTESFTGLAIDGYIEGKYSQGDEYKFWKPR